MFEASSFDFARASRNGRLHVHYTASGTLSDAVTQDASLEQIDTLK